jgi:hypothetical protein
MRLLNWNSIATEPAATAPFTGGSLLTRIACASAEAGPSRTAATISARRERWIAKPDPFSLERSGTPEGGAV